MPGFRNSKKARYNAIFAQAAIVLARGEKVLIRPESEYDWKTIMNYWYDWRKINYAVGLKSDDSEVRRVATTILNSKIALDTDNDGRVMLSVEPYITPKFHSIEEKTVHAQQSLVALSTNHGSSVPVAEKAEADRFASHGLPWQQWAKAQGGLEWMLACLDTIPRDMRANPDLASVEDLPQWGSAEAQAMQQRFLATVPRPGTVPDGRK